MVRQIAGDDAPDVRRPPGRPRYDREHSWADLRSPEPNAFDPETDPWAWATLDSDEEDHVDIRGCQVTAVLVTLDAERWLPETLAGLARLQHKPTRLIAIDNASSDSTPVLLERARVRGVIDAVYSGKRTYGFGAAVTSALQQDRATSSDHSDTADLRASGDSNHHWLWLLHDDAVPAPDALERLLAHVTFDDRVDITGPKLLLPQRRQTSQQLSEVGVTISGTGRRELILDLGEIDQGQRDQPMARLGVSTCGMLVRTAVWHDLGGLDPGLPIFRDGVDFGWRAHLAGYRVVTTPRAQFVHRQVGRAGLRPLSAAGRRPGKVDRQLGMLVVVGHAARSQLPLVWLRLVWGCVLHALGYLIGKVPGRSLDEVLALTSFVAHPGRIRAVRRRRAGTTPEPGTEQVVRALRPPWWSSFRVAAEAISGVASERFRSVAGDGEVSSLDELTGDDFTVTVDETSKTPWLSPIVAVGVLSVIACLFAARSLYGTGSLMAPALLPAPESLSAMWQRVWDPIVGAPGQSSPPWLALIALGSTVFAGQPEWFVTVLVCGVVPLSLLTAYPVIRRVVHDRRVRLWAAGTYALLPVLLGGSNQGRLSLSIFAIALPLLVLAARSIVLRRPRAPEAWRGGWGAGVLLVVLVSFEPSMIIFALLIGISGALALRRSPRKAGRIGLALGLPLLVLAPWWPSIITEWGRLFTGPDAALTGAPGAPAVWQLLLGRDLGPGLPPLWLGAVIFGVIWVVAAVALLRRPRSGSVVAAWLTGVLALAMAVGLSRMVVSVPPVGTEVRPWVGVYLLIGFGALVLAAGAGVDGLAAEMRGRSFSGLQPASLLASVVVALVTVLGAGWWVWAGAAGPIDRAKLDAIPPYVLNALASDAGTRLLAVDLTGDSGRFSVISDDQIRLGDADRGFAFAGSRIAADRAADLVIRLTAGTADADIAPQLADLGIGYVWIKGADEEAKARIDNTPGLGTASGTGEGIVWQLQPAVSRAALIENGQRIPVGASPTTVVRAVGAERRLLTGTAVDRRWHAALDGQELTPVEAGWQQAYAIPSAGGTLDFSVRTGAHWFLYLQGLVLFVACVLAAPAIRRPEVRDPTRYARRAATLIGGGR